MKKIVITTAFFGLLICNHIQSMSETEKSVRSAKSELFLKSIACACASGLLTPQRLYNIPTAISASATLYTAYQTGDLCNCAATEKNFKNSAVNFGISFSTSVLCYALGYGLRYGVNKTMYPSNYYLAWGCDIASLCMACWLPDLFKYCNTTFQHGKMGTNCLEKLDTNNGIVFNTSEFRFLMQITDQASLEKAIKKNLDTYMIAHDSVKSIPLTPFTNIIEYFNRSNAQKDGKIITINSGKLLEMIQQQTKTNQQISVALSNMLTGTLPNNSTDTIIPLIYEAIKEKN